MTHSARLSRSLIAPPFFVSLVSLAALPSLLGCGDDKKSDPASATPSATTATAAATAAASSAKPAAPAEAKAPNILVDEGGAYIGGERVDFKDKDAAQKLAQILAKHAATIKGKPVAITATRNAKTADVVRTLTAFTSVDSAVTIKTQTREKKDVSIIAETDDKAGKLADCTVIVMVLKDRATASWHLKGGTATKYAKGMAGPDMSQTGEGVAKQWKTCPAATTLALSGDDTVEWGLVFDLSQTADPRPPSPTNKYLFPRTTPIAGRPVKLAD
jgi:hypothetical protein